MNRLVTLLAVLVFALGIMGTDWLTDSAIRSNEHQVHNLKSRVKKLEKEVAALKLSFDNLHRE